MIEWVHLMGVGRDWLSSLTPVYAYETYPDEAYPDETYPDETYPDLNVILGYTLVYDAQFGV